MKRALIVLVCCLLSGGCATYYRVTDPVSGRMYYTTNLDQREGGAVRFKDAATGAEVTIQNSTVQKVSREEYETSRGVSGRKL